MTKRQRCDKFLLAAKHWQNREEIDFNFDGTDDICYEMEPSRYNAELDAFDHDEKASAALSEAAALGFDLETVR